MLAMNSLHPKLKFEFTTDTHEIAFLDVCIYKGSRFDEQGIFDLRVHQKSMNLYLYIPYHSCHTDAAKRSFIQTELMRYVRNSSEFDEYWSLKCIFFKRLRDRGYPAAFLNNAFQRVLYCDRHYFLYPSREILSHPLLRHAPPRSPCLLQRILRMDSMALHAPRPVDHHLPRPPVFIIPFSPVTRAIPPRPLLTQRWELAHMATGLPRPIIAYQSCPSIARLLVYGKSNDQRQKELSKSKLMKQSTLNLFLQPHRVK